MDGVPNAPDSEDRNLGVGIPFLFMQQDRSLYVPMFRYDEAVESHGKFHVAVSGGSLPKFLKGLSKREDVDWTKWWVYFCDERYVPNNDPDSNYGALNQVLLHDVCF